MNPAKHLRWLPNSIYLPLQKSYRTSKSYVQKFSIRVEERSSVDAAFHCCVQKTASRWLLRVITDDVFYKYSGLKHFPYPELAERVKFQDGQRYYPKVPRRAICSALYYNYDEYASIPKPPKSKAFFVVRDPRDIVVSHYYSTAFSHRLNEKIAQRRKILSSATGDDRFKHTLDFMEEDRIFENIQTWNSASKSFPDKYKIFRFEHITDANNPNALIELFEFLDIRMPIEKQVELLDRYSFSNMKKGAATFSASNALDNAKDTQNHYRNGKPGEWRQELSSSVLAELEERQPNLLMDIGYI